MKHFIIEVTYVVPIETIDENLAAHRAFLQDGYDRGWLLCSGPQEPRVGGMVVARAPSLDDLQNFFKNDPYKIKNLAIYHYIEFQPVKYQDFLEDWAR